MRFDKAWVIVRKEFSEYRKNRYILYSLVLMPMLMAVVLPMAYLIPITTLGINTQTEPYDLHLNITNTLVDVSITNATFYDLRLVDCTVNGCVVVDCALENCTVEGSLVSNCEFNYSLGHSSAIWHCNIRHSTIDPSSSTTGSIFVGQESQDVYYTKLMINMILMFFVLIPSIIPTVIASYSFVGEKLNRSLEPLLATPTTDTELLAGKTLAILIPSVLITWVSLIPTVVIVDLVTKPIFGYYMLPDATWLVGVFLVAPLVGVLSVLFNVIISARVTDVRSSQQIGSVVILPVIAFFVIGLTGLISFSLLNMLLLAGVLAAIDIGVIYLAIGTFQREKILVRWK